MHPPHKFFTSALPLFCFLISNNNECRHNFFTQQVPRLLPYPVFLPFFMLVARSRRRSGFPYLYLIRTYYSIMLALVRAISFEATVASKTNPCVEKLKDNSDQRFFCVIVDCGTKAACSSQALPVGPESSSLFFL